MPNCVCHVPLSQALGLWSEIFALREMDMAGANISDGLDVLGYFAGFWLFLFSKGFRESWILEFRGESGLEKAWSILQAALSFSFGVLLPGYLIFFALRTKGLV
jgi:hypothetical protein